MRFRPGGATALPGLFVEAPEPRLRACRAKKDRGDGAAVKVTRELTERREACPAF
jgi:hypothetical protein